jgi:hypothetical protein
MFTDFSGERAASNFRAKDKSEDGGSAFLKSICKRLPRYMAFKFLYFNYSFSLSLSSCCFHFEAYGIRETLCLTSVY